MNKPHPKRVPTEINTLQVDGLATYIYMYIYTYKYIYFVCFKTQFINFLYILVFPLFILNSDNKIDFVQGKFKSRSKSASSILQALSCRFFGCNSMIYLFWYSQLTWICCVSFSSKSPPRDFLKQGRARFRQH